MIGVTFVLIKKSVDREADVFKHLFLNPRLYHPRSGDGRWERRNIWHVLPELTFLEIRESKSV